MSDSKSTKQSDKQLNEILRSFQRTTLAPGYWANDRAESDNLARTRQLLFQWISDEVVGENQHTEHKEWDCPCGLTHSFTEEWHATNNLRDSQREILEKHGWEVS